MNFDEFTLEPRERLHAAHQRSDSVPEQRRCAQLPRRYPDGPIDDAHLTDGPALNDADTERIRAKGLCQ
jgi:hypothetical protein